MKSMYPCLWFDGNAKNAAEFYCTVFKNSKINSENPLVVMFELSGLKLMGLNGGPQFKINPSISFFFTSESAAEIDTIWNKLADGGNVLIPLDRYPWSEHYGWVQDRFGVTWQLSLPSSDGFRQDLTPSFLFTADRFGKAEEAMIFYSGIFERSAIVTLIHYPESDENSGKVMYAEFDLNQYNLIAMDGPGVHNYTFNEAVSFVVECETQEEIDFYWEHLTEDGEESMCGWLKDKFGVSWQIVPSILSQLMADPSRSQRVINAFMKMRKFDIETLLKA